MIRARVLPDLDHDPRDVHHLVRELGQLQVPSVRILRCEHLPPGDGLLLRARRLLILPLLLRLLLLLLLLRKLGSRVVGAVTVVVLVSCERRKERRKVALVERRGGIAVAATLVIEMVFAVAFNLHRLSVVVHAVRDSNANGRVPGVAVAEPTTSDTAEKKHLVRALSKALSCEGCEYISCNGCLPEESCLVVTTRVSLCLLLLLLLFGLCLLGLLCCPEELLQYE